MARQNVLNLRLSDDEWELLEKLAASLGVPKSNVIRMALREWAKKREVSRGKEKD